MDIVVTLVGVLASGVVATIVTYFLNTRKECAFFMRQKSEELYLSAERFDRALSGHFLAAYPLLRGTITWNDYNDLTIENARDETTANASLQVEMLIDLYFEGVHPSFSKYLEQRSTLQEILGRYKEAYKAGEDGTRFFGDFHRAMGELDLRSRHLKAAIIKEGRKFARAKRF